MKITLLCVIFQTQNGNFEGTSLEVVMNAFLPVVGRQRQAGFRGFEESMGKRVNVRTSLQVQKKPGVNTKKIGIIIVDNEFKE